MKKLLLILLAFLCAFTTLTAAENEYVIASIQYNIKGSTQPIFLERRIGLDRDRIFNSIDEIEEFKKELLQDLNNLRIFEDQDVTYTIDGNSVTFLITLDDAWGLVPFGYPKFTSEGGFRVAARLYWYNSLGTLTDTTFQVGVNVGAEDGNDGVEVLTWDSGFKIDKILLFDRYFSFGYKFSQNRNSIDSYKWSYYNSNLSFGTEFDLNNSFTYSPSIELNNEFSYKPVNISTDASDIKEFKVPSEISLNNTIGAASVNWYGNFRDGYSYGISNATSIFSDSSNNFSPNSTFSLYGNYYKTFGDFPISIGTKLMGIFSINSQILGLGDNIRGVESGNLYGNVGLFSNNNIFVRVIKIDGLAEAIFSPQFDIGITDKRVKYGTGADFILYVDKFKSLVARGSISWDLTDFNVKDFQIDITSSLFF